MMAFSSMSLGVPMILAIATFACDFSKMKNVLAQVLPKTDAQYVTLAKCSFVTFGEFTYDQAKAACEARNASLGFFLSPSDEHAVRTKIDWNLMPGFQQGRNNWVGQLWLGIKRSQNGWVWDNPILPGFPVPFTPWGDGVTGIPTGNANCIAIRHDGWTPLDCTGLSQGSKAGALCTAVTRFPSPDSTITTSDNYCGVFLLPPSTSNLNQAMVIQKNYFFIKGSYTYALAVAACQLQHAQLSTARSPEEFAFITSNMKFSDVDNKAWLGLRRAAPGASQFLWIDMMPNTHVAPFLAGQPDQSGDCVAYQADNTGKVGWRVGACTEKMGAICETFAIP